MEDWRDAHLLLLIAQLEKPAQVLSEAAAVETLSALERLLLGRGASAAGAAAAAAETTSGTGDWTPTDGALWALLGAVSRGVLTRLGLTPAATRAVALLRCLARRHLAALHSAGAEWLPAVVALALMAGHQAAVAKEAAAMERDSTEAAPFVTMAAHMQGLCDECVRLIEDVTPSEHSSPSVLCQRVWIAVEMVPAPGFPPPLLFKSRAPLPQWLLDLWGLVAQLLGGWLAHPPQREKLNQLLRLPTGAFVAKEGERPAYEVRARMFSSWRRLMCAWAPLMDDPANAPGDAEKRLTLLLMPLRDLWRREEAGGQPRTPADAAELAAVHLEAAEGWCALAAWLSDLSLCLAGDMVWGLAVRPMAAHWHPALRKRFLSSVDAIYRRHATLAGLWLCRAQGRRMLCEAVSASLSAEAQAVATAAAAASQQPSAAPPLATPPQPGATLAPVGSGADCEASSVDLLCDVWVAALSAILRAPEGTTEAETSVSMQPFAPQTRATYASDKRRAVRELLPPMLLVDPAQARAATYVCIRKRLRRGLRLLFDASPVEVLGTLWLGRGCDSSGGLGYLVSGVGEGGAHAGATVGLAQRSVVVGVGEAQRSPGSHHALSLSVCCAVLRAGTAPAATPSGALSLPASQQRRLCHIATRALLAVVDSDPSPATVLHTSSEAMAEDALLALSVLVKAALSPGPDSDVASAAYATVPDAAAANATGARSAAAATADAAAAALQQPRPASLLHQALQLITALWPWLVRAQGHDLVLCALAAAAAHGGGGGSTSTPVASEAADIQAAGGTAAAKGAGNCAGSERSHPSANAGGALPSTLSVKHDSARSGRGPGPVGSRCGGGSGAAKRGGAYGNGCLPPQRPPSPSLVTAVLSAWTAALDAISPMLALLLPGPCVCGRVGCACGGGVSGAGEILAATSATHATSPTSTATPSGTGAANHDNAADAVLCALVPSLEIALQAESDARLRAATWKWCVADARRAGSLASLGIQVEAWGRGGTGWGAVAPDAPPPPSTLHFTMSSPGGATAGPSEGERARLGPEDGCAGSNNEADSAGCSLLRKRARETAADE